MTEFSIYQINVDRDTANVCFIGMESLEKIKGTKEVNAAAYDRSWYGFESRVSWCACFVSWCADQCGYIDAGIIPKFSGCVTGVNWFRGQNRWLDGSVEPNPGMIIFFDWDNKGGSGPQDGLADHVGIVQRVENGIVYTIEGNSGDSCRQNQYPVGHYEILGYGALCP